MRSPHPCLGHPCIGYFAGHQLHWVQANCAARRPETWRRGVLTGVHPHTQTLAVTHPSGRVVTLWHHGPLTAYEVLVGADVRTCEEWSILAVADTWISVCVVTEPGLWEPADGLGCAVGPVITDIGLGIAEPLARGGGDQRGR